MSVALCDKKSNNPLSFRSV